jgi:hypothetical protein
MRIIGEADLDNCSAVRDSHEMVRNNSEGVRNNPEGIRIFAAKQFSRILVFLMDKYL